MMRSRSEVQALVLRAARGAGLPPGHAEDVAQAAVAALSRDPACAGAIAAALPAPAPAAFTVDGDRLHLAVTPVVWAGPMIRDALDAGAARIAAAGVDCPALLAAMLPDARLTWTGADAIVQSAADPATPPVPRGQIDVDPTAWAAFEEMAARTIVPETDLSRIAGAGAGVLDVD